MKAPSVVAGYSPFYSVASNDPAADEQMSAVAAEDDCPERMGWGAAAGEGSDDDEHFHDQCGVVGTWLQPNDRKYEKGGALREAAFPAANYTYLGLHALQHRGQEATGIAVSDGTELRLHKAQGLVGEIFARDRLRPLVGHAAIGHVRYATQGAGSLANAQPLLVRHRGGALAVAHNGNLVNAAALRRRLESEGSIFQSTSDTECLIHLMARSHGADTTERLLSALDQVEGAYSFLLLDEQRLYAARDPHGFRPLWLGMIGESYVVASETCAFDLIGATPLREIEPGEVVVIGEEGLRSIRRPAAPSPAHCVFELIYFARPDSSLFGADVHQVRKAIGRRLALEHPVEADVVIPVPDSGTPAALGFAEASGIPFETGLIRSHYVGRTFIEPVQQIRQFGVRLKLNPIRGVLQGKRVVVVDDSIVRGNTSARILNMLWEAGAREVHMRVASPPTIAPCHYGIDTPDSAQLIAANLNLDAIRQAIGASSLGYISLAGLLDVVGDGTGRFCHACFSEKYPVPVPEERAGERPHATYEPGTLGTSNPVVLS